MKKLLFTLACCLLAVNIHAQTASEAQKIIIVDGYFFDKMPVSAQQLASIYLIETPGKTSALGLTLSEPLPEKALKYAIPAEQVPESALLLERYREAIENAAGTPVKVKREATLKVGDKFPEFSAVDIDGRTWSNDDVKGKVMVLNLWFTGCRPCRAEMPELSAWKDEMPDVMFFSSTYEDVQRARPVLEARKFNWIPLVNDTQFTKFIGNNGYPMTIVVDKEGTIAQVEYGTSPVQREELKEKIRQLRR